MVPLRTPIPHPKNYVFGVPERIFWFETSIMFSDRECQRQSESYTSSETIGFLDGPFLAIKRSTSRNKDRKLIWQIERLVIEMLTQKIATETEESRTADRLPFNA